MVFNGKQIFTCSLTPWEGFVYHRMDIVLGLVTCFEWVKCEWAWHLSSVGSYSILLSSWPLSPVGRQVHSRKQLSLLLVWINEDIWTDLNQTCSLEQSFAADPQVWGWELNVCCCKPVRFWHYYLSKSW